MRWDMQRIMGYIRRAVTEYHMLEDGDRVAVGVSGGKDSVALLAGLAGVRRYLGVDFFLAAVSLDNGFPGVQTDFTPLADLCRQLDIPFHLKKTEIGAIVFQERQESNPCSKIALGHHYDDAVETLLMNLFHEGRIGCFSPVSYLSRKDLTMIRPLIFAPEKEIASAVRRAKLPVVKNPCPMDGYTQRQWTKDFLADLEKTHPGVTKRVFGALQRGHVSNW